MAIEPKADKTATPDTAQADDAAVESNREIKKALPDGWTFSDIGRQFNACDDPAVSELPVEFWVALGMEKWAAVPVQMARLITYAHSLDLFHLKGAAGGPEKVRELAEKMGTTVDQLYRLVEQSISEYSQHERRIALLLADESGEYAGASGEVHLASTSGMANGNLDPDGDHSDLPFDPSDPKARDQHPHDHDLDVDATIKAVDDELADSPGMDSETEADSDKEEDDKNE